MIDAAVGSASKHTESLADVTQKLGGAEDRDGRARASSRAWCRPPRTMERDNKALEARLKASKQEITQLQENLETVRNESLTDPLTTLANRKYFDEALPTAIVRGQRDDRAAVADDDRHRSLQELQRHLRPPHRRPGAAAGRPVGQAERQGPGHRGPLRRRGIRHHAAAHRAARGDHGRRPHPPRGDEQGTDEALDRRASRPRHHLDRRRHAAAAATPPIADRARRRLPLRGQAQRPQPRDLRDRPGGRAGGRDAVA